MLGDSNDDSDTNTIIMGTHSDDDLPFDPDLTTGYGETEQATPAKDPVIKDMTSEVDDRKSEKIVPVSSFKEIMEGSESSKPCATPENVVVEKPVANDKPTSSRQDEDKAANDMLHIRMISKEDFTKYSHLKSGRYYLLEQPTHNDNGRKSGLITNLAAMMSVYPCGAIYQRCYTELPMFRIGSANIDDFSPLRIQYWDNSYLYVKSKYTVGVKVLTEVEIKWLLTPSEEEKTIVERAMSDEMNKVWDTITVPNPTLYINFGLYFDGHLDSNHMLPCISNVLQVLPKVTEEMADILKNLSQESKI